MLRFNTLDHFIVSGDLFATAVNTLTVIHDVDNTSDHDPIVLELGVRFGLLARADKNFISKPAWHRASVADLDNYRLTLLASLSPRSLILVRPSAPPAAVNRKLTGDSGSLGRL